LIESASDKILRSKVPKCSLAMMKKILTIEEGNMARLMTGSSGMIALLKINNPARGLSADPAGGK
jgi:hypothetical protein